MMGFGDMPIKINFSAFKMVKKTGKVKCPDSPFLINKPLKFKLLLKFSIFLLVKDGRGKYSVSKICLKPHGFGF